MKYGPLRTNGGIDADPANNAVDLRCQDVLVMHSRIIIQTSDESYITDTEYVQMATEKQNVEVEDTSMEKRRGPAIRNRPYSMLSLR